MRAKEEHTGTSSVGGTLNSRGRGIVFAIISSATFGFIPLFSLGPMHRGFSTLSILFYRFALATLLFGAMALLRGIRLRVNRRQFFELLLLGVLCYSGSAGFLIFSYRYIPSGIATTINFLYPIMVALLMRFVFGERVKLPTLIAIGLSLLGVGLMSWNRNGALDWRGVCGALATVVCYGLYIVGLNKLSVRKLPGSIVTFYVLLFSSLLFMVLALATGGIDLVEDWHSARDLLLLAIVATIVSNLTLVLAVQSIGSTYTSLLGSMEPLTAVGIGMLVFGEELTWVQMGGVVLVVVSVMLVVFARRKG